MTNIHKKIAFAIMLYCGILTAASQTSTAINGTITNEFHNLVPYAKITVVGTKLSVTADKNGKFSFDNISSNAKLLVSCNGYKTKQVRLKGTNMNISLASDIAKELAIIPMIKNSRPNYSIGSSQYTITSDELKRTHHQSLGAALAGRMPGLYVQSTGNEPGNENYSLVVRGASTTNDRAPLILIDGVMGGLASVNVDDVESVTLMKDAPALALYGMQASAGIIYIKTKRGKDGAPKINIDASYSIQSAIKRPNMLSSYQYANLLNEAWKNDGMGDNHIYSPEDVEGYKLGENQELYPNNNWYDMFLKKKVETQNVNFSAMGGGKYVKYYTSLGYLHQDGPFKASDALVDYGLNRFDLRSNIDLEINDFISGYVNITGRIDRRVNPRTTNGNGDIMKSLFYFEPNVYGPLTPDGKVAISEHSTSSTYGMLNKSGYNKGTNYNLTVQGGLNLNLDAILKGLSAFGEMKYHAYNSSTTIGTTDYERWKRDLTINDKLEYVRYGTNNNDPLLFSKQVSNNVRSDVNVDLDYKKMLGKHQFNAHTFIQEQYYTADDIKGLKPKYRMNYGGQLSYGYNDIVFTDFLASYMGSEQFEDKKRYGFFPSADVALVWSNMPFLKGNKAFTYLKTRASYGINGNDGFGDIRFFYDDYLGKTNTKPLNYLGYTITITSLGNHDLTWERSKKYNLGVDLSLFNSIILSLDYYKEKRTDILTEDNLTPLTSGITSSKNPKLNSGSMQNEGIDLSLGFTKHLSKDLSFAINSNLSYNQNKILDLGELPYSDDYAYQYRKKGYSLNQCWGYKIDYSNGNGYFNTQEELDNNDLTYIGKQPRLGDFKYQDINGDKIIDEKDISPIGESTIPQIAWGIELSSTYKGFDVSILFQGLGKFGGFNSGLGYYENSNNGRFFNQHLQAWTSARYEKGEAILAPALTMQGSSSQKSNDYYYQKKDFTRLKNVEIGYTLPSKLFNKAYISNLRIYVSGMNLLTWDSMKSNDVDIEGGSITNFPTSRYWNFGLNITF